MLHVQTFSTCIRPHSVFPISFRQSSVKWVIIRKSLKATHSIRWMKAWHGTLFTLSRWSIIHASNTPFLPVALHPSPVRSVPQARCDNSCRLTSLIKSTMCSHITFWHFIFIFANWFSYKKYNKWSQYLSPFTFITLAVKKQKLKELKDSGCAAWEGKLLWHHPITWTYKSPNRTASSDGQNQDNIFWLHMFYIL